MNSTVKTDKDIDFHAQWATGIVMQYKDDSGNLKTVKFTKEQVGDVLQVRDPLFSQLLEPYKSYAKTPDRIIQFIDGESAIKSVGEHCFSGFVHLKNVVLPVVETGKNYAFSSNSSLENLYICNLTGINNTTFYACSLLDYIDINSSTHYSISNIKDSSDPEYKEGQIVVPRNFPTAGQVSICVGRITKISRDDITVL